MAKSIFLLVACHLIGDYTPVSLREAEKLIRENRERLMTPRYDDDDG